MQEQELASRKKSNEQPNDPNTKEKFDEAKEFAELFDDLKKQPGIFREEKEAEELQEEAKLAQADADINNEQAEEALTRQKKETNR